MLSVLSKAVEFVNTWADGISLLIFLASAKFGYDYVRKGLRKSGLLNNLEIQELDREKCDLEQVGKYIDYLEQACTDFDDRYEKLKAISHHIVVVFIEKTYYAEQLTRHRMRELQKCQERIRQLRSHIENLRETLRRYNQADLMTDTAFCALDGMLKQRAEYLNQVARFFVILAPQFDTLRDRAKKLNDTLHLLKGTS